MELGVDFAEDVNLEESIRVHVKITNKFYARCVVYGSLIKPPFSQPKHCSPSITSAEEIGLATVTILARPVPAAIAGVVLLSGGLSDSDVAKFFNAVNVVANKSTRRYYA
ncbi:hypothetical protein BDR07DRAFT_1495742 [Suillus spraguei]|nr:hypothetical protein BDR07DRAFT_1495742 [Suillus spraguei]